jgi:hypothetical protein
MVSVCVQYFLLENGSFGDRQQSLHTVNVSTHTNNVSTQTNNVSTHTNNMSNHTNNAL